jgi:hypothetical protein
MGSFQLINASYPTIADRHQVSVEGGVNPEWKKDGREVYFAAGNNIMSVEIGAGAKIVAGVPRTLFSVAAPRPAQFSASPDGSRFLVISRDAANDHPLAHVVVNWAAKLEQ